MANEKIKIDVSVSGGKSVNEAADAMSRLDNATRAADKSTTNLTQTFEEANGKGVKPLSEQLGQLEDRLYELAQAGNKGSKEFNDLATEIARLKIAQNEADAVTDKLSKTIGEKLVGKVQTATDAFTLADVALKGLGVSSKSTEELMAGLVVAKGVADSFSSLEASTGIMTKLGTAIKATTVYKKADAVATKSITAVQWLWNAAMAANPIGAIIVAVTALIAAGYFLVTMFQKAAAETKNATKINKDLNTVLKAQQSILDKNTSQLAENNKKKYELATASGLSKDALRALEKQLLAEEIAQGKVNYQTAEGTKELAKQQVQALKNAGASKELIKAAQDTANEAIKAYNVQVTSYNGLLKSQREATHKYNVEDVALATENRKKRAEAAKQASDKKAEDRKSERESVKRELKDAEDKAIEDAKKEAEKAAQALKNSNDKLVEQTRAKIEDISELNADATERELEGDTYAYNEKLRLITKNRDDATSLLKETFDKGLIEQEEYNKSKSIIDARYTQDLKVTEEENTEVLKANKEKQQLLLDGVLQANESRFVTERREYQNHLDKQIEILRDSLKLGQITQAEFDVKSKELYDNAIAYRKASIKEEEEEIRKAKNAERLAQTNGALQAASEIAAAISSINEDAAEKEIMKQNTLTDDKIAAKRKELESGKISQIEFDKFKAAAEAALVRKTNEIEEKAFLNNKKASIAAAIISTAQSAISSYTSLSGIPVVGVPLGIAAAVAATAAGISNISKIKATTFESSGDGSTAIATPISLDEGSGASDAPTPPSISLYGQAIGTSNSGVNTQTAGLNQQTEVRAYVVESDITDTQNTLSKYKQRSEIG